MILWELRLSLGKCNGRTLMASIALVAFASRALIAPGFMPATGRAFSIEICWDGFPADMLAQRAAPHADSMGMGMDPIGEDSASAHSMAESASPDAMLPGPVAETTPERGPPHGAHHHSGGSSHSEHCVFGTTCSAALIPYLSLPIDTLLAQRRRPVGFVSIASAARRVPLPQPRAPPDQLS